MEEKAFTEKKIFLKFSRVDGHSAKQTPFVWSKWVYLTSGCYFFLYKAAGRLGRLMLLSLTMNQNIHRLADIIEAASLRNSPHTYLLIIQEGEKSYTS